MGSPACAAAALVVGGAALVAMRPALKTGKLELGAGAARGSPLPSPARVGAAFARVPQLLRKTQRCACMLLAAAAAAATTKPTEPQRSLRRFC